MPQAGWTENVPRANNLIGLAPVSASKIIPTDPIWKPRSNIPDDHARLSAHCRVLQRQRPGQAIRLGLRRNASVAHQHAPPPDIGAAALIDRIIHTAIFHVDRTLGRLMRSDASPSGLPVRGVGAVMPGNEHQVAGSHLGQRHHGREGARQGGSRGGTRKPPVTAPRPHALSVHHRTIFRRRGRVKAAPFSTPRTRPHSQNQNGDRFR